MSFELQERNKYLSEVFFLDGPYRGTVRWIEKDVLMCQRYLKLYVPIPSTIKKLAEPAKEMSCLANECRYMLHPIPPGMYNEDRWVAFLGPNN